MEKIKYTFLLAFLVIGCTLCAQSKLPSNDEIEESLEKVENGMEFMMQFFNNFSGEMLQGLNIEGIESIELSEADQKALRESMQQGFDLFKNIDMDKMDDLLKQMEDQFKDFDFNDIQNESQKDKKEQDNQNLILG